MNINEMIEKTEELEADIMGRRTGTFKTPVGEVTCFMHRHGSRTGGNSWGRIDFYLDNADGFNKIKREELEKLIAA